MIITHVTAENFLKYTHLELAELPRHGIIAISGQNESGKSTIGETVCFALFGRTFSIGDDEITRVIRWGESRCSVRLGFAIGDKNYEIARFLDSDGNHGARLFPAGDEEHPFAKGINAVNEALGELLGYQFEEFVESFYLAQREITTPHPHSHAIKTMAGISALEKAAEELAADLKNEKQKLPDTEDQIKDLEHDIKELKIEPGKLNGLESDLEQSRLDSKALQENEQALNTASQAYIEALPRLKSTNSTRRLSIMLSIISFIVAVSSGTAWFLYNKLSDSTYTAQLTESLNSIPAWSDVYIAELMPTFLVSSIVFLIFFLISSTMKNKTETLLTAGKELSKMLEQTDSITKQPVTDDTDDTKEIKESDLLSLRKSNLKHEPVVALVNTRLQQLENSLTNQQQSQKQLESSVKIEQERIARADALLGVISNQNEKLNQIKHHIRLCEIADELTAAAAKHFSQRFNKDLRELASRTLPLFTEDRYEHLHIGDDLSVRAFSSLKRDYMDLDEISSGTQRQIMLAVRLALSQELVNTTGSGDQFIFLDEPFAFFDETRSRNAMAILPKLSEEIKQVWVIAQSFPEDTKFDRSISCLREYDSLPPSGS